MTTSKLLALSLLAACATEADLTTTERGVEGLTYLLPESGTGQHRMVMNAFEPLVVNLTDADGQPIANTMVAFTTPAAGASAYFVGGGQVMTDEDGRATITPWATSITGTYKVWASAGGAEPMPFTLTNLADAPAIVMPVLGSGQVRTIRKPFADPLTVEVWDRFGNAIEGAEVEFIAPASGASVQMPAGNTTVTDDEGRASVFAVAGDVPGSYTVIAKVANAPNLGFTLTNVAQRDFRALMDGELERTDVSLEAMP